MEAKHAKEIAMSDRDREMNYDDDGEEEMLAVYYECSRRAVDALADHEAREAARQYRDRLVPAVLERVQTVLKRALSRINGEANHAHKPIRSDTENPVGRQYAQLPEEIKRRQIALIARYVMTVRAR